MSVEGRVGRFLIRFRAGITVAATRYLGPHSRTLPVKRGIWHRVEMAFGSMHCMVMTRLCTTQDPRMKLVSIHRPCAYTSVKGKRQFDHVALSRWRGLFVHIESLQVSAFTSPWGPNVSWLTWGPVSKLPLASACRVITLSVDGQCPTCEWRTRNNRQDLPLRSISANAKLEFGGGPWRDAPEPQLSVVATVATVVADCKSECGPGNKRPNGHKLTPPSTNRSANKHPVGQTTVHSDQRPRSEECNGHLGG